MNDVTKKRVAILGGGCGAMTAAHYLSNTPALRDRFDVTVYQIGWRLGGKGASGRNASYHQRIEEHGLHVWGGFYYNAFRMVQECLTELNRPAECPLRTWDQVFRPCPHVAWQENLGDKWVTWPITTPTNDQIPGTGALLPTMHSYIVMLIGWIKTAIDDWPHDAFKQLVVTPDYHPQLKPAIENAAPAVGLSHTMDGSPHSILGAALALAERMESKGIINAIEHHALLTFLSSFNHWLVDHVIPRVAANDELRRITVLLNLGLSLASGLVAEHIASRGFMAIDDYDLIEFLRKYGAGDLAANSAPIRGYYDYFFAFENGDVNKPRMSAGMGAMHLLRLIGEYKGNLFYKMSAGMGDSVFGPLYELCVRNGVTFKFFHRVEQLIPSADGLSIDTVRIKKQVDLIKEPYDPLVLAGKVPSWPSEPRYEQIVPAQVDELKRRKANLEDLWTDWDDAATIDLQKGRDFDAVVLGLSIGAFPFVCPDLIARDPAWKTMVDKIQSIQTQAMQLWWSLPVDQLGWAGGNVTGTAYGQPLESWSDMSQALEVEEWPPEIKPQSVVYFCGPMLNPPQMPEGKNPDFGDQETEKAWNAALEWSQRYIAHLYPKAADGSELKWDLLVDPYARTGADRFRGQYARANYTPTERYVVDLPGTNQYRLEADTSGYDNLALAGDWLFTGLGGAVESAVISGMQAARALAGTISDEVVGEMRSPWRRPPSVKPLVDPSS